MLGTSGRSLPDRRVVDTEDHRECWELVGGRCQIEGQMARHYSEDELENLTRSGSVADRPRFGCDSLARTLQLVKGIGFSWAGTS